MRYLAFFLLLGFVSEASALTCESVLSPFYKMANPTAQEAHYKEQYGRPISFYNGSMFHPIGTTLEEFIPENAVVVESGSGPGTALQELARLKHLQHVLLIDTHDWWHDQPATPPFESRVGWAEEEIEEIPDNSVDRWIDDWGAFAYSPDKAYLMERIYRKLKPGGKAALLYPSGHTPTFVSTEQGVEDLTWYTLSHTEDGTFEYFETRFFKDYHAKVFLISKPVLSPPVFQLGLRVVRTHAGHDKKFPEARLERIKP